MYLPNPRPYSGMKKLVFSFDIGTTYSSISYVILEDGVIPEVRAVTQFPYHELVQNSFKIPSVMFYDWHGEVKAAGNATLSENTKTEAQRNGWFKASWFKLHVKPPYNNESILSPLPPEMTVVSVLADFMSYLAACAEIFIGRTYPQELQGYKREYVISHPNGWEGVEQNLLREAAAKAGLINKPHSERLHFVTEGEASLHFCVVAINGLTNLSMDKTILVADLGGGTADFSSYRQILSSNGGSPVYEEVSVPDCVYAGSVSVTRKAQTYIQAKLSGTDFEEEIPTIMNKFDQDIKNGFAFTNASFPQFVRFSNRARDSDERLSIKAGQLKLPGSIVAEFFQDSIQAIRDSIIEQTSQLGDSLEVILLVGGYAANRYLTSKIKELFGTRNVHVIEPNQDANKAAADGSLLYYLHHLVASRKSRLTMGVECFRDYDPNDIEHVQHSALVRASPTGRKEIMGMFDPIIVKGNNIAEKEEFRKPYWLEKLTRAELSTVEAEILCYDGVDAQIPSFLDDKPDKFRFLCTVIADTTQASKYLKPRTHNGKSFYRLDYEVIIIMGLTELKAQVAWKVKGKEIRTPAKIIYTQT